MLQKCNAVDYSLFLLRFVEPDDPSVDKEVMPDDPPFVPPSGPTWRTGIRSPDGKYTYRAATLDFFWAKHKMQPQVLTSLVTAYNTIDKQGPMSITTTAEEYRTRFLDMIRGFVEIKG